MPLRPCLHCGDLIRHGTYCYTCKPRELQSRRWQAMRQAILARDDYTCHYCGEPADEVDHRVPISRGGQPFNEANAVASCLTCNRRKGARTT